MSKITVNANAQVLCDVLWKSSCVTKDKAMRSLFAKDN